MPSSSSSASLGTGGSSITPPRPTVCSHTHAHAHTHTQSSSVWPARQTPQTQPERVKKAREGGEKKLLATFNKTSLACPNSEVRRVNIRFTQSTHTAQAQ